MLTDLSARFSETPVAEAFIRLYTDDQEFGRLFAYFHEQLNQHFEAINGRAKSTHHYWADNSRAMLALIDDLRETMDTLKTARIHVEFLEVYASAISNCAPWLSMGGGSTIPEDFQPIQIVKYRPVFTRPDQAILLKKDRSRAQLNMVGQGSYAIVYSFVDPDYGIKFAVKRAKKDLEVRDLQRFRQEFDVLKSLSFPYIVEVYEYDTERNEYKMEFCDETLRSYIARRNQKLTVASRKRIALQILYGINYIHHKGLLHRDLSLQNILLKVFDDGAVLVKLSDFGLVKDLDSTFTRTGTDMRGTIRDPILHSFKEYSVVNELYAVGWILSYVFTGRESLGVEGDEVGRIVQKCTANRPLDRYQRVIDVITDVERLGATPTDAPA